MDSELEEVVEGPGGVCGFAQEERLLDGITSEMAFPYKKSTKRTFFLNETRRHAEVV